MFCILLIFTEVSNRHKPHIANSVYIGTFTEGNNKVSLIPSLTAYDDDAPQLSGTIDISLLY